MPTSLSSKRPLASAPAIVRESTGIPYQPLVFVFLAASGGILLDHFLWALSPPAVFAAAFGLLIAWVAAWRFGWERAATCCLLSACFSAAGGWHAAHWRWFPELHIARWAGEQARPVALRGIALEAPRTIAAPAFDPGRIIPTYDRSRLRIRVSAIRDGQVWIPATGSVALHSQGHLLGIRPGDSLSIFGQLQRPRPSGNPGEFDYAKHQRSAGIACIVGTDHPLCVSVIESGSGWYPSRWLSKARQAGHAVLDRWVEEPGRGVAKALLLGSRDEMSDEQWDAFARTGCLHLLTVSGLHVGIVGSMFYALGRCFPLRRTHLWLVIIAVTGLYTLYTGARPPALRAMILVWTLCGARLLGRVQGRRRLSFNTLALAGLAILAVNPSSLLNSGTQLSFLAMAAIMWCGRFWRLRRAENPWHALAWQTGTPLARRTRRVVDVMRLATLISLTIWLTTMPLIAARFHIVSWVGIPLSILLSIPCTLALLGVFILAIVGWGIPPLAPLVAGMFQPIFSFFPQLLTAIAEWPGTYAWVPGPSDWWLVGWYTLLWLGVSGIPILVSPRQIRWLLIIWVALGLLVPAYERHVLQRGRLAMTAISVGHGLSVLLELPGQRTMLYDAGTLRSPESGARTIESVLWSKGITHLDAVIISHDDADHFNTLPHLAEKFSIGHVYSSPTTLRAPGPALRATLDSLKAKRIPVRSVWSDHRFRTHSDCRVEVFHPTSDGIPGSDNANSLVLAIECGDFRFLLTGDLEDEGLYDVMSEEPWHCDVLLAPHHGSLASNPVEFLDWCQPQHIFVSGGSRYLTPSDGGFQKRTDARVWHTAIRGAVTAEVHQGQLYVSAFLSDSDVEPRKKLNWGPLSPSR